jgi:hypothetical protein
MLLAPALDRAHALDRALRTIRWLRSKISVAAPGVVVLRCTAAVRLLGLRISVAAILTLIAGLSACKLLAQYHAFHALSNACPLHSRPDICSLERRASAAFKALF